MKDTEPGRTRPKCRCGHLDTAHPPYHPSFETQHCCGACARCDCPYFHSTTYKTRTSQLRNAARDLRGQPLQPRLFSEDTAKETENTGDPARPLARKNTRSNP